MKFYTQTEKIALCEHGIAHVFDDKKLAAEALNAEADGIPFYAEDGTVHRLRKNDRLAVYGDSAMSRSLCHLWYLSGLERGAWTNIRNAALANAALANTGFSHNLDACISTNNGTPQVSAKMMATAVEAILGAVHKDGGDEALARVM